MADSIVLEEELDPDYEPTDDEIKEYAKWLGMDIDADQEFFYIAKEGLQVSFTVLSYRLHCLKTGNHADLQILRTFTILIFEQGKVHGTILAMNITEIYIKMLKRERHFKEYFFISLQNDDASKQKKQREMQDVALLVTSQKNQTKQKNPLRKLKNIICSFT